MTFGASNVTEDEFVDDDCFEAIGNFDGVAGVDDDEHDDVA